MIFQILTGKVKNYFNSKENFYYLPIFVKNKP